MFTILCPLILVALSSLICWMRRGKINGIPEPPGNYVLGHVFQAGGNFCKTFLKWKHAVGPVFQLRFFNVRIVVFNDKESIAKVCGLSEASGRSRSGLFMLAANIMGEGVAFGEGPKWTEQRQLLLRSLKTFGISNPSTERRLQEEFEDTLNYWKERNGEPFELHGSNTDYVFNTLFSVIASKRLEHSTISHLAYCEEQATRMDTVGHKLAALSVGLAGTFTNAVEEKIQGYTGLMEVARDSVIEHQKDWVRNKPRDAIDQILDKVSDDVTSAFYSKNIKNGFAIGDTIAAAVDTVSRTLEWLMLHVARNSEAASKLHAEIDRVFGDDQESWPSLADRENMPYTQAVILEALRMGSAIPFGVPHKALEDFEFNGARIPKGTILITNLYGVHYDPQVWDRPEKFEPQRFLTPEGDKINLSVKNKIVAFGLGRRICPGYEFAMDSMFLYVVNAYRKFKFEIVGNVDSIEGRFGVTMIPPTGINMRAIPRV